MIARINPTPNNVGGAGKGISNKRQTTPIINASKIATKIFIISSSCRTAAWWRPLIRMPLILTIFKSRMSDYQQSAERTQQVTSLASDEAPRVLVSVLGYNSSESLSRTLRAIRQQSYPNFHLQFIDNASTDGLAARVRREFPELDVRVLSENRGYTGGSNHALRQALAEGYDHVLLCTHDVEIDAHALARLVETTAAHPLAGVVGGVELRDHPHTHEATSVATAKYSPWTSRLKWSPPASVIEPFEVPYVHGALLLFTRRALEAGFLMDENLFMYFDEIDTGRQLHARGLRAYVDPRVTVRHSREVKPGDALEGYLMQRNRAYMSRKYGRWYHRAFFTFYTTTIELPAKIILRLAQGHTAFARACARGHIDGLRGRDVRREV